MYAIRSYNVPFGTLSQVALRFCLDHPHIATVVAGIKNLAEVEEVATCTDLPSLDPKDVAELQRMYERNFKEE